MKLRIVAYILIVLAIVSVIYNATLVSLDEPLSGESQIAVYGIIIALCAIILLVILLLSYRISDRVDAHKASKKG